MDNPVNQTVEIEPQEALIFHLHLKPGVYPVYVGDYGWDDGDLYIRCQGKKFKLRDIKHIKLTKVKNEV